ncbi:MAG TPA: hypothetical protein DEB74_07470 [Lachnospiraceae bacterium]|nr:hypothetical protein [Lachnospiraceae bacterium]
MKKIRRFLQVLLFINFMIGLHDGMKTGNLIVVLINGTMVLVVVAAEKRRMKRNEKASKENIL